MMPGALYEARRVDYRRYGERLMRGASCAAARLFCCRHMPRRLRRAALRSMDVDAFTPRRAIDAASCYRA